MKLLIIGNSDLVNRKILPAATKVSKIKSIDIASKSLKNFGLAILAKNKKKAVNIMNDNISTTEGNILILKSFCSIATSSTFDDEINLIKV